MPGTLLLMGIQPSLKNWRVKVLPVLSQNSIDMPTRKKPFEVVSPDADGWNEIIDKYVSHRNMENQLVMIIATPKGTPLDDVQELIDDHFSYDVSCEVNKVHKTSFKNLKFHKDKVYYIVDLQTYNPFKKIPDVFGLDE